VIDNTTHMRMQALGLRRSPSKSERPRAQKSALVRRGKRLPSRSREVSMEEEWGGSLKKQTRGAAA